MRSLLTFLLLFSFLSACSFHPELSAEEQVRREARAESLVERATFLMTRGDQSSLQSAVASLELARDLLGDTAEILDALGCVDWRLGNLEASVAYFRKAIELDPEFALGYTHLGFVALEREEKEAARALFKKALRLDPEDIQARNNLSVLEFESNNLLEARHESLKALQVHSKPSKAEAYNLSQIEKQINLLK